MLYLISDYAAENPRRKIAELLRFEEESKCLHEMTADEVNAVTSKWTAVNLQTAVGYKLKISQYIDWLKKKGVDSSFDPKDVVIPIKKEPQAEIYSTKDIRRYYEILEIAALKSGMASTLTFKMTKAAGILAFYGLSDQQILDIRLLDVTENGVAGYDLPLTKADIDCLLDYKNLQVFENRKPLFGSRYIRTANPDIPATVEYLNRPLLTLEIDPKYDYIIDALRTSKLNLYGKFDRAYHEEKKHTIKILTTRQAPQQWFADIFKLGQNQLIKRKKEYVAYRDLRDSLETNILTQEEREYVINRINTLNSNIADMQKEVERLRKQLQQ